MEKYVAYFRVSTTKQGVDGYGIDAQRAAVRNFVECGDGSCIEREFVEVESGTKKKNHKRVALKEALVYCKIHKCILVISKLDRLSRNAAFLMNLKDSGVNIRCVDLPDLNTLTLGLFATFAQHEAERISIRTKEALAARKARGLKKRVVNNLTPERIKAGHEAIKEKARTSEHIVKVVDLIRYKRAEGLTYQEISNFLMEKGFQTSNGKTCDWKPIQVQRIEKRFASGKII
jgi:DNA invertase Pin-like site-specific DNA recombinase